MHHHAKFDVAESGDDLSLILTSDDGQTQMAVEASVAKSLPATSIFPSLEEASRFFEAGSVGYSPAHQPGEFDGMELCSQGWRVEPLDVRTVRSSFFDDRSAFPAGSVEFDCALLMRGIEHEWRERPKMTTEPASAVR